MAAKWKFIHKPVWVCQPCSQDILLGGHWGHDITVMSYLSPHPQKVISWLAGEKAAMQSELKLGSLGGEGELLAGTAWRLPRSPSKPQVPKPLPSLSLLRCGWDDVATSSSSPPPSLKVPKHSWYCTAPSSSLPPQALNMAGTAWLLLPPPPETSNFTKVWSKLQLCVLSCGHISPSWKFLPLFHGHSLDLCCQFQNLHFCQWRDETFNWKLYLISC